MPRVPTRDSFEAVAGVSPSTTFDTGSVGREQAGPSQMIGMGETIRQNSMKLSKIEIDAQREANELRANEALNKARQKALDLTYNTDGGFVLLKGRDALERPEGKSLDQEYGEKFEQYLGEVSGELVNDHQRQLFRENAAQVATGLKGDIDRHMMTQFGVYHSSVADGALKLSQQEAELAWNDPDRIDRAINGVEDKVSGQRVGGIRQAIEQKARLTGMSPTEVQAEVRTAESGLHTRVIQAALVNNNVAYADLYYKQNLKNMTGSDILSVKKVLDDQVETSVARTAVDGATRRASTAFVPDDLSRLQSIVMDMESKGKRYGRDGKLLESPKGALGEMQVMPDTSRDPGFGVAPAKDDSPEELARVGRDYLTAMLQKYGDVSVGLAAYNAGPGKVDAAVKEAEAEGNPNAWLSKLPEETRNYVAAGLKKYNSGGGATPMKTQFEFVQDALADLSEDAPASTREKVRELAEKQYKALSEARTQKSEQALANAQRLLVENGGSFAELPADAKMELLKFDPKAYEDATKYAEAVRKGDDVRTNDGAYIEAYSNPGTLGRMADAPFQQYLVTNFSQSDRPEIVKLRAGVMSGTNSQSTDMLDDKTVKDTLDVHLTQMGVDPNAKVAGASKDPDTAKKVANVMRFVRDDLYSQQKTLNRRLTPEETEKRINFLFTRNIKSGRGWFTDAGEAAIFDTGVSDIPSNIKQDLTAALVERGITKPTDDDLLRAYWRLRVGNAKQPS